MKAVGIKALKNNLSRYIQEVRAGETVWVTDRDEVVAEIHKPTVPVAGAVSRWRAWMNAQERAGHIRAASSRGPSLEEAWSLAPPARPVDLKAILAETRRDSR